MRKPPLKRFPKYYSGRKETLTEEETEFLCGNKFIIEEKLDGSLKVEQMGDYYLMLEDMKYVHTIFYDNLTARYILVDVCLEDGTRLNLRERDAISRTTGYYLPGLLLMGNGTNDANMMIEFQVLGGKSHFGSTIREGFVVKSEVDMTLGGKYSWLDLDGIERFDKSRTNQIRGRNII